VIFKLTSKGNNLTEIASRLYVDKIPTPSEYKNGIEDCKCIWTNLAIYSILYDEQYIGTYTAGKTSRSYVGSKNCKKIDKSKWIIIPNHHPAIIDESLFKTAQENISYKPEPINKRENGTSQRYGNIERPLKGKVVCGYCNHKMRLSSTRNAVFTCMYTMAAPDTPCHKFKIGNNELSDVIYGLVCNHIDSLLQADNASNYTGNETETVDLITENKRKVREMFEQFTRNEINEDEFASVKRQLNEELKRLNQFNSTINSETGKLVSIQVIMNELKKYAKQLKQEGTLSKSIIDLLVEKINVYPGNRITVEWIYSEPKSVDLSTAMIA